MKVPGDRSGRIWDPGGTPPAEPTAPGREREALRGPELPPWTAPRPVSPEAAAALSTARLTVSNAVLQLQQLAELMRGESGARQGSLESQLSRQIPALAAAAMLLAESADPSDHDRLEALHEAALERRSLAEAPALAPLDAAFTAPAHCQVLLREAEAALDDGRPLLAAALFRRLHARTGQAAHRQALHEASLVGFLSGGAHTQAMIEAKHLPLASRHIGDHLLTLAIPAQDGAAVEIPAAILAELSSDRLRRGLAAVQGRSVESLRLEGARLEAVRPPEVAEVIERGRAFIPPELRQRLERARQGDRAQERALLALQAELDEKEAALSEEAARRAAFEPRTAAEREHKKSWGRELLARHQEVVSLALRRDELWVRWHTDPEIKEALSAMQALRALVLESSPLSEREAAAMAASVEIAPAALAQCSLQEIRAALALSLRLTGGRGVLTLERALMESPRADASLRHRSINLGASPDGQVRPAAVVHETAHHAEYTDVAGLAVSRGWVLRRAEADAPVPLSRLLKDAGYEGEEALPDKFITPYVGKVYEEPATEVLSIGLERFHSARSMLELYLRDEEHFALVLGMVRR